MLAGSCSTRNFDFCVAEHPNGEKAFEKTPSHSGGWAGIRVSSAPTESSEEIKPSWAWHGRVVFRD